MSTKINCFLSILLMISVFSCKKNEQQNISLTNDSTVSSQKNSINDTNIIYQKIDSITQWVGTYKYFESWKESPSGITSATMDYTLKVSKKDSNSLVGILNIEGFQTSTKEKCSITYSNNKLSIYADNLVQFTLEKTAKGKLATNWFNLQPAVISNQINGKVRFNKIK